MDAQRRSADSGDDDAHALASESHDTVVRSSYVDQKTFTSTGGSSRGSLSTDESLESAHVATVVTMRPKLPPKPKDLVPRRRTAEIVREFEEKVSPRTLFKPSHNQPLTTLKMTHHPCAIS